MRNRGKRLLETGIIAAVAGVVFFTLLLLGEQLFMNSSAIRDDAQHRLRTHLAQFLPQELVDELLCHHTSVTYAKDSIIFLQGSPADLMFWIMSGLVKLYCPISEGDRTLVRLCGPGDVLGYADFIDGDKRHLQAFEAQALTKCSIALFTREHAVTMLEKVGPADSASLHGADEHGLVVGRVLVCRDSWILFSRATLRDAERSRDQIRHPGHTRNVVTNEAVASGLG